MNATRSEADRPDHNIRPCKNKTPSQTSAGAFFVGRIADAKEAAAGAGIAKKPCLTEIKVALASPIILKKG
ncbi:MAG: hypothetical protein LPJ93_04680 [Rhodobacterales bacterium]|nr:hypothetical protein [Rhodobacterales bacterium]